MVRIQSGLSCHATALSDRVDHLQATAAVSSANAGCWTMNAKPLVPRDPGDSMQREIIRVEPLSAHLENWKAPTCRPGHKRGSTYCLRAAAIRACAVARSSGPSSPGERACEPTKAPLMGSDNS